MVPSLKQLGGGTQIVLIATPLRSQLLKSWRNGVWNSITPIEGRVLD